MNWPRIIAGIFCGCGALLLIYKGEITAGVSILSAMVGFFVGEHNGYKKAQTEEALRG